MPTHDPFGARRSPRLFSASFHSTSPVFTSSREIVSRSLDPIASSEELGTKRIWVAARFKRCCCSTRVPADSTAGELAGVSGRMVADAVAEVARCSGVQFDPDVVEAFLILMSGRVEPAEAVPLLAPTA